VIRRLIALLLVAALGAAVAGCGKKGKLEAPPGKKSEFPRQYPQ